MCARCILYIRTSLRTLQAGIYNNSHLIKNLFRLPKKNLGSFTRVSTVARNPDKPTQNKLKNKNKQTKDKAGVGMIDHKQRIIL